MPFDGFAKEPLVDRYSAIFAGITDNQCDDEIKQALSITTKALRNAKAAYLTLFPDQARDIVPCADDWTILIDECVPPSISLSSSELFGWSPHINFLGGQGQKDPEVYAYALKSGFDAIITMDRAQKSCDRSNPFKSQDLTTIATAYGIEAVFEERANGIRYRGTETNKLPVLIHLDIGSRGYKRLTDLLTRNRDKIEFALKYRPSPYISITEKGVR